MLRDTTLYGSICVLSLVVGLVAIDYRKASDKFPARSARPTATCVDQTVSFASNIDFGGGHVRPFHWSQSMDVPIGAIPIGPEMMPFSSRSMEEKVKDLFNQLSLGQPTDPQLVAMLPSSPSWSAYDDYNCRYSVMISRIDRAIEVAYGHGTNLSEVMMPELQRQLENQTDFIFADFEVRIAPESALVSDGVDTVWRLRMWHEYEADAWHIISLTRTPQGELRGGKPAAG